MSRAFNTGWSIVWAELSEGIRAQTRSGETSNGTRRQPFRYSRTTMAGESHDEGDLVGQHGRDGEGSSYPNSDSRVRCNREAGQAMQPDHQQQNGDKDVERRRPHQRRRAGSG